jgi:hypothetical protein
MRDAGSAMARVWGGIKGALGQLEYTRYIGPKSLNGGEVVVSAGMSRDGYRTFVKDGR